MENVIEQSPVVKEQSYSARLNQEQELREIVYDACGKFGSIQQGMVTFTDTLTKESFRMPIEKISRASVRYVLESAREKKDLSFRLKVVIADAIIFLTRMHNVPRGVAMKAAEAAVTIIIMHLRGESNDDE